MPRASSKTENDTPKRAPRRQVVRRIAKPRARTVKTAEVETVEKLSKEREREREDQNSVKRKAPTQISSSSKKIDLSKVSKRKILVSSFIVASFIGAFFIGSSDVGQIDVNSKITERNNQIASGISTEEVGNGGGSKVIPVQNTAQPPSVPNAGLRGRGVGTPPVNQPPRESVTDEVSTSTATSTDDLLLEDIEEESVDNNDVAIDSEENSAGDEGEEV